MSLLDRLITLNLLEINSALAKVENPEQVRDAVLNEIGGVLEAAGAELRQLQRNRDSLLQNRRTAEKEVDEKRTVLNAAAEAEKEALKKQVAALGDALVRMDEQIAEQNRDEAALHKYVNKLQETRREASEWSPRRRETKTESTSREPRNETKTESPGKEAKSSSGTESSKAASGQATSGKASGDNVPPKVEADPTDPFSKMKRLKERMDAFQARAAIDEEELQAFITEQAIAEEETRRVIEQNLSELKKKMNRE